MPPYVAGMSKKNAHQKITNPTGSQGVPFNFFTTLHVENRMAKLMPLDGAKDA
jgi:hypothetical protein